ncbi:MAG: SDR family NAD(P)-dependent oxidoreductase [Solirubrobacteraceae bacterium]
MKTLNGQHVLLTGATGGLGHAIARALAARGAAVVLTGRRAEVLEPLAAEIGGVALDADLSDRVALERLLAEAGRVDVLVANAALPASGNLADYSVEQIDRALEVNLRAPVVLAKLVSAGMIERGRGHLVFISSISGKVPSPGSSLYNATKFGLRGFAGALREEYRPHGIGVSTVFPGFISGAGMFADTGVKLPPGVGTKTPEDVAAGVISAIEDDRGEVDVAPIPMRLGAKLAGVAPDASAKVARLLGGDKIAAEMIEAQRERR